MRFRFLLTVLLFVSVLLAACGAEPTATSELPAVESPELTAAPGTSAVESPLPTPTVAESPLPTPKAADSGGTLTVMTHDSFDVSKEVVTAFQEICGCEVQFLQSGDTGLMLNQALLSKGNPLADVIYGVDNTFLSRALAGDILEPYQSPLLSDLADDLKLDPEFRLSPVDYGDVCLN